MADRVQASSKLEYRPNTALVLAADRKGRRTDEPTGEAVSLQHHLASHGPMGGRARRDQTAPPLVPGSPVAGRKREREEEPPASSFLAALTEVDAGGGYRPRTAASRAAYDNMLTLVARGLGGDAPHDMLTGACEEVLAVLKDGAMKDAAK